MTNGVSLVERPLNETVMGYAPGSPERSAIKSALAEFGDTRDLTSHINGKTISTERHLSVTSPHRHARELGRLHLASPEHITEAVDAALAAKAGWAAMSFDDRASVFMRAAELLATRHRGRLNAATMLGQSKTVHQAEIDSAAELIDFLRFNVWFGRRMLEEQPLSPPGIWNRVDLRPLDGFVLAITPFNFTAIAGNLPSAPALMGNTVVWKPAVTQSLAAQVTMEIFEEAGLPPGVINLVHGRGADVGNVALPHPDLGGVHFTGSTGTFQLIWKTIGDNISRYRQYPRLVGETGGKDFVLAHPSADLTALTVALTRGAFEYQGQKCSAASRAYVPKSVWPELRERLAASVEALKMGDVEDFSNFMGAVIDEKSFGYISRYVETAKADSGVECLTGGTCDDKEGWFIDPTVLRVDDPKYVTMQEELFGPVLTLYVYDDERWDETLALVDQTSPYALTGAVFARDRRVISQAAEALRFAAGNFYINDKPTGAVVGQQPFGGGRASGTNDKAGSMLNLTRWISTRTIKENFEPPRSVAYPFMGED
ncbi:MAG: L-glutamate gamma-semialdehyde dehydrogenase [Myxococcota bacterium]